MCLVETACSRCCCCSACHCLFALFALCTVHVYVYFLYVCCLRCSASSSAARLPTQIFATVNSQERCNADSSAACLPAPMQHPHPPTTISASRLMPFGIAAAQGVGRHLATRKSKCTLHFRFVHISASVAACSRRAHLPNGACICDTCKQQQQQQQQLQRLKRWAWSGGRCKK